MPGEPVDDGWRTGLFTAVYLFGGPFVVLSQRYLTISLNSLVICHYRALVGCLSLLILAFLVDRKNLFLLLRQGWTLLAVLVLGVVTGGGTLCMLEGIRYAGSLPAALAGILVMPLLTTLSLFIFHDEHPRRHLVFFSGSAMAMLGAAGYAWTGQSLDTSRHFVTGLLFLGGGMVSQCIITPLGKHLVQRSSPVSVGGLMQGVAACGLLAVGLLRGAYRPPQALPLSTLGWLSLSGAVGMLIGAGLGMVLLRRIGVVRRQVLHLCMPPLVGLFGYLLFDEAIALAQAPFILVLLVGCGGVVAAGRQATPKTDAIGESQVPLGADAFVPASSFQQTPLLVDGQDRRRTPVRRAEPGTQAD
jgi:drug/metabolite transporter (DMT)-like permease